MAALNDTRIMTKSSGTAGEVPTQGDLYIGELAVNLADRKLYTRNVAGQIIELGGATGPELPEYDPLFQIVAVDTAATGIYGDPFPKTLQVPPEVQEGDLAVAFLFMRSDLDNTLETIGITQTQLTPLLDQQEFTPGGSATSSVAYRAWSGDVDAALIASGIEITSTNATPDIFYTIYYIRNGEVVTNSATGQDTTASGVSAPSTGASVTGPSVLPGNIAIVAAQNLYAFADTSGVRILEEDADITVIRGPLFAQDVQRRNTTYIVKEGDFDHKIGATTSSNSPAGLTDGFHVLRVDIRGKLTAVTSVNGQTGIVDLGIQDMNDFELNRDFSISYTLPGPTTSNPIGTGQWGVGAPLNNYFTWFDTDPVNDLLSALNVGDSVDFITEAGFVHTAVVSQVATQNGTNSDYLSFDGYPWPAEITAAFNASESITVRTIGENEQPLADNDILQWADLDQKFKPASPASLFTEVDGGTFGSG